MPLDSVADLLVMLGVLEERDVSDSMRENGVTRRLATHDVVNTGEKRDSHAARSSDSYVIDFLRDDGFVATPTTNSISRDAMTGDDSMDLVTLVAGLSSTRQRDWRRNERQT